MRVGWSAIFGIIPGLGDVFDVLMALMVYRTCCQADIPSTLRGRMMMNIILDFAVGLVPILGDVADAVFKANTRNAALLYGHLKDRGRVRMEGGGVIEEEEGKMGTAGELGASVDGRHAPALGNGSGVKKDPVVSHPVHDTNGQTSGTVPVDSVADHEVQQPLNIKTKAGSKGGWLSRFGGTGTGTASSSTGAPTSKKEPDLEAGERV